MNPSTQDILSSFEKLPTDKVIILPNNKNIVMAANQAKDVTVKKVAVVPSRTVPQGLAAMLALRWVMILPAVVPPTTRLATLRMITTVNSSYFASPSFNPTGNLIPLLRR